MAACSGNMAVGGLSEPAVCDMAVHQWERSLLHRRPRAGGRSMYVIDTALALHEKSQTDSGLRNVCAAGLHRLPRCTV